MAIIEGLHGEKLEVEYQKREVSKMSQLKRITLKHSSRLEESFMARASCFFDFLPLQLRAMNSSLSSFKKELDDDLVPIPDRPVLPYNYQAARSNSLINQIGQVYSLWSQIFFLCPHLIVTD